MTTPKTARVALNGMLLLFYWFVLNFGVSLVLGTAQGFTDDVARTSGFVSLVAVLIVAYLYKKEMFLQQ